jgi:lysyl-tRNA synthetase class 2
MSQTPESTDSSLIGQRQLRLGKIASLRQMGVDPYPAGANRTHFNKEITDKFAELENTPVTVVGRLMNIRTHGKIMFYDIEDDSGTIQIYIKQDTLTPHESNLHNLGWNELDLLDTGDHVEVSGTVTKTEAGQISVLAREIKLASKSIRPLPTELEDKEDRYRRRYLDMTLHPEVRERFRRRSKFWQAVREFMNSKGFVEINIPVLEHTTGGADAKPFVTHYDALNQDFFLRISHELPLKRLLGGGFDKVYDIGVRFRNEGFSDEHLPEHVAMEWYWAYANAEQGMELTKEMFRYVMQSVYGTLKFHIKGFDIDLSKEWEKIDYVGIIKERFNVDPLTEDVDKMNEILKQNGVDLGTDVNRNRVVDNLWKLIRKTIAGPAFLVGEPKVFSPLAKSRPDTPEITERFHALIAGSELANAYSELNDPVDQLDRFLEQEKLREGGDEEAQMLDIDFVEMLEYGMPPACGFGLSERVFWFFEGVTAKEGVPFPQLKAEVDNLTKKIYPEINFDAEQQPKSSSTAQQTSTVEMKVETGEFPTREAAEAYLHKYVENEYLLHHSEMVASAMEAVARHLGENADKWYVTGLIHDWDFDKWPSEHPGRYEELRSELGVDQEIIEAIKGHGDIEHPRQTKMMKALLALDELSGLFYAYMKMVGSYGAMKISSMQKKLHKELSFAAKIDRNYVLKGIAELGIPEEELLTIVRDTFAAKYDK